MAHYQVYWRKGRQGPPMASHWYELNGVITWASPQLHDWVGKRHRDLVVHLYHTPKPVWWVEEGCRVPDLLDQNCVPPTRKYHKQLKRCVDALLEVSHGNLAPKSKSAQRKKPLGSRAR